MTDVRWGALPQIAGELQDKGASSCHVLSAFMGPMYRQLRRLAGAGTRGA